MTEEILTKVRKILAKAEDPAATPEEAETYTAKAAELIAEYGIDRALLARHDPDSDVVGDRVVVLDPPPDGVQRPHPRVPHPRLRCRTVQRRRYVDGAKQISLHLFGFESDLLRAELLYTSLLMQATTALTRTVAPPWESTAAFRRSWLAGFTTAIGRRLADAEREAERRASTARAAATDAGGPSVALMLADRSAVVRDAVDREYPHLERGQARRLSGSGGMAGWQAGQRADLGGGSRLRGRSRGELAG